MAPVELISYVWLSNCSLQSGAMAIPTTNLPFQVWQEIHRTYMQVSVNGYSILGLFILAVLVAFAIRCVSICNVVLYNELTLYHYKMTFFIMLMSFALKTTLCDINAATVALLVISVGAMHFSRLLT